jgi:hypothetical protein
MRFCVPLIPIQCNLRAPVCKNCTRRGHRCSFLAQKAGLASTYTALRKDAKQIAVLLLSGPLYQEKFDFKYRLLLSHYVHETSSTIPLFDIISPGFWHQTVPSLAQSYGFLNHCIVGVSALHLSHLLPPKKSEYLQLARSQYLEATSNFRASIQNVTQDNAMAICAFVVFVVVFHFRGTTREAVPH